jgi:hypothetical protein
VSTQAISPPVSAPIAPPQAKPLTSWRPFWAKRFGRAPFLPMSRAEMEALGWDSCDIVIVTGDAYVDHPSFGMAVIGRVLEQQGFRVGIIAQPDWHSAEPFKALGKPNLFFGVAAGNMDSMINRYTADRKIRSDDAYTPGGHGGARPDRSSLVYANRCKEAFPDVPVILGGIEASLRRIAHYDYWQDKVRRSILMPRPTCCCTAMPSARSSRWRTASPGASRWSRSPTCAARPSSCATGMRRTASSSSTPPRWTGPAASTSTSTRTR